MKHNIKVLLLALLPAATMMTSCKKYFDADNPSTISQDAVFSSQAYTESAVTGVYAMLIGDNGYGNRISCLYPQSGDDFKTSGSYSPLDRRGISMYGASPGNTELLNPFRQLYKGIERANICIKYIPLSDLYTNGTAAERTSMQRLYGEVLTLRAQFYYELIRNWGDIPFYDKPASDMKDLYLPKTDRDVIYDQLLTDLKTATDLVPWRSAAPDGFRVTKGFVKGLRARIALARGGYSLRRAESQYGQTMARPTDYLTYYQIARDECYEIMQQRGEHNLNPVYEDLFRSIHGARKDDAHEIIFEVGAFGGNASTDSKIGYYNGVRHNTSSKYGGGGGGINAVATYFYEFDSVGDCRRDVTVGSFEIDASGNKIMNTLGNMTEGKYSRSWTTITGTSQNLAINWIIMRFSDVLLMFAEADNEINGGASGEAINAFEEVRKRAFVGFEDRMGTTPADKQGFFNAIVQERLLEFGGEGIRKYDLIRWNLLNTKLTETRSKLRELMEGTGRYANVPLYIFTKANAYDPSLYRTATMASIDFGTDKTAAEVLFTPNDSNTPPSGYTVKDWRNAVSEESITGTSSGLATYFKPNARELFPLHTDITTENYNLKQDYGY
jgi:starch-binding outer membrane protein, SusD/RagB family